MVKVLAVWHACLTNAMRDEFVSCGTMSGNGKIDSLEAYMHGALFQQLWQIWVIRGAPLADDLR